MQARHLGQTHEMLIDLRRVFHRAGAKAKVDGDVVAHRLLRETHEVAHQLWLGHLWQAWWFGAVEVRGDTTERVGHSSRDLRLRGRRNVATLAGGSNIRKQGLVPSSLLKLCGHANTSVRTSTSRSMSSFVCTSVTAHSDERPRVGKSTDRSLPP